MGQSCFLKILLLSALLALSISHGIGRKLIEFNNFEDFTELHEEIAGQTREMIELMDYKDPGPNTNPKAGYLTSPPPPQG